MKPTTGALKVPGATIHYEKRGNGPLLLLIPGGAADAAVFEPMAAELAKRYTVVSYDPRGLSRSPLEHPVADQEVSVWSDDAYRLIEALARGEGVRVFGSSSGAIVALDLLAKHPEKLRLVVAHEPPLVEILQDPGPSRALFTSTREAFRTDGVGEAMLRMNAGLGGHKRSGATELSPENDEMSIRMRANLPVFLSQMLCQFTATRPDVAALERYSDRLVLAVGSDSREQVPLSGPAIRLADLVGSSLVEFPGGHVGYIEHPREFLNQLLKIIN